MKDGKGSDIFDGMVWVKREDAKHVIGLIMKHYLVSTHKKAVKYAKACDLLQGTVVSAAPTPVYSLHISVSCLASNPKDSYSACK
jgi:hypothetical protein